MLQYLYHKHLRFYKTQIPSYTAYPSEMSKIVDAAQAHLFVTVILNMKGCMLGLRVLLKLGSLKRPELDLS